MIVWSTRLSFSWRDLHFRRCANSFDWSVLRPSALYRLPKIFKQGVPLRTNVNTTGAPVYCLAKHLMGLLSPHSGNSLHHMNNSADVVPTLGSSWEEPQDIKISFNVESSSLACWLGGHESPARLTFWGAYPEALLPYPDILIRQFWWIVLWRDQECGYGFTTVSCYCQLIHEELWGSVSLLTRQPISPPKTHANDFCPTINATSPITYLKLLLCASDPFMEQT